MVRNMRSGYDGDFKAKVALECMKGEKTLAQRSRTAKFNQKERKKMSEFLPVIGDLLDINAERSPNKTALIDPEKNISITWSEWKGQVMRFANSLIPNPE